MKNTLMPLATLMDTSLMHPCNQVLLRSKVFLLLPVHDSISSYRFMKPRLMASLLIASIGQSIIAQNEEPNPTVIRGRVLNSEGLGDTNVWVQVQTMDPSAPDFARTGGWALAHTNSGPNGEF